MDGMDGKMDGSDGKKIENCDKQKNETKDQFIQTAEKSDTDVSKLIRKSR